LPKLATPGGIYYDPIKSKEIEAVFEKIKSMTENVDGNVNSKSIEVDRPKNTRFIKDKVKELGADEIGIANLNPMYVYSHVGRGPEKWGKAIVNNHKFAIAFTVEMNYSSVETAPALPITEETAKQYLRAAKISIETAKYIRDELGYSARAHISDSNYQIMLPPVAHDAGLGELGRHGYLISKKFGSRVRLGGITTDLPLIVDKPIIFGVQNFCVKCMKCADNCPSGAITKGGKDKVRGVEKWSINVERCIHYWRVLGTDCGLCMKVCPYSHPPTFIHNIIRKGIEKSPIARSSSVLGDDLFYGRKSIPRNLSKTLEI